MDIRTKLRQALLEGKHKKTHKNEYGCVMIYLDADKKAWDAVQAEIADEDLYNPKDDPSFGKENDPHVTVLFGLHNDIPDSDIEEEINKIKTPSLSFSGISTFTNPLFDVLKFDVISDDMHELNKRFTKYPHTTDFPVYHPHVTLAYVKAGKGKKYVTTLNKLPEVEVIPASIVYSKADGTKKTYDLA